MTDLVAMIIGISDYPGLPPKWTVDENRTAQDAVLATKALVARGVNPKKIKLFLSPLKGMPKKVDGVVPTLATSNNLQTFILHELGTKPFVGDRFFFFCSAHGVTAEKHPETLIVLQDSVAKHQTLFFCLAVEQLSTLLQAMPEFNEQIFCINACRTPQEWAMVGRDEVSCVHIMSRERPPEPVTQSRFFSARELRAAPVEDAEGGYSNRFTKALVECVELAEWPPRAREWNWRLKIAWPSTEVYGLHGPDTLSFKRLEGARYDLDRRRQQTFAQGTLEKAKRWHDRRHDTDLWRFTLMDLHACEADRLDFLLQRLERTVFTKSEMGGVQRVARWPNRDRTLDRRKLELREELTYCLTEEREFTDTKDIVGGIAALGARGRVVYVQIDGPISHEKDRPLVEDMLAFWRDVIGAAAARVPALHSLPLLLVGHVEPELKAGSCTEIDATLFYHAQALGESNERRLNRIRGEEIHDWLDPIFPKHDPRRIDVEGELARALGVRFVDDIDSRLMQIVTAINERTI